MKTKLEEISLHLHRAAYDIGIMLIKSTVYKSRLGVAIDHVKVALKLLEEIKNDSRNG